MNDKKTLSKWIDNYDIGKGGALLILLVVSLLPFLILSFYNHPSPGDDYFETDIALQKGFWEAQKWWYFNNSGRWFASMAISLNPLVFHTYWAYKLNAAILLALLLIAGYWLSGKLFSKLNISARIGICSLFIFAYLIRLPIVGDGIFWLSGANSYLTAEIMSLFLLGCIISYTNSGNKKRYLILSCLLLIAIIS
ncbi:MAG TPA: hypothetical protein VN922_16950, partial [Bacteroidia bacterium]|nr:hypothetical protein [Bacteroidia bacterium]